MSHCWKESSHIIKGKKYYAWMEIVSRYYSRESTWSLLLLPIIENGRYIVVKQMLISRLVFNEQKTSIIIAFWCKNRTPQLLWWYKMSQIDKVYICLLLQYLPCKKGRVAPKKWFHCWSKKRYYYYSIIWRDSVTAFWWDQGSNWSWIFFGETTM